MSEPFRFKEEMFNPFPKPLEHLSITPRFAAEMANNILDAHLKTLPKVYGSDKRPLDGWNEKSWESSTHEAIIWSIEPIKRECVHHDAETFYDCGPDFPITKCKHCGKKLKPVWRVDE
jgi:hypothetical protein